VISLPGLGIVKFSVLSIFNEFFSFGCDLDFCQGHFSNKLSQKVTKTTISQKASF
jgi:hypothetical protein